MPATALVKRKHPTLGTIGLAVEHFPTYRNRALRLHQVDVVLLSFILRGTGVHHIGPDRFAERGASLAVTHYGQVHDILTDDEMEVINIYLDPSTHILPTLPAPLQAIVPLLLPLHPRFVHAQNRVVRVEFADPQPLAGHLFAIERELRDARPGWHDAVQHHWTLFLILACRQVLDRGFAPTGGERSDMESLRQHLDQHFADEHTLQSLADRVALTPTSLCRAFKAYTSKPVFDYLIERRIQAAMLRLRSGTEKIVRIALDTGFGDLSFFNRKFRQIVGQTPTAYRKQFAAGGSVAGSTPAPESNTTET